jgi:hypothetical protein
MIFADWFGKPPSKIGFEDVLVAIQYPEKFLIINTLSAIEQDCLIINTLSMDEEEHTINELLTQYEKVSRKIILYGKNNTDTSVENKNKQLKSLGIGDIYVYSGGLFEWMLLQDIYSEHEFPTTKKVLDILKYKPSTLFGSNK